MKTFVSGAHTFRIELHPNPEMASVHTTIDLKELRANVESAYALIDIGKIPGIEATSTSSFYTRRHEFHLEIGKAFDRQQVAEKVALALANIVYGNTTIEPYEQVRRPFTVIGAFNDLCSYGPSMNNDGEIKLEKLCVMAFSPQDAIQTAQKASLANLELTMTEDSGRYILDQPVAIEGNPLGLEISPYMGYSEGPDPK